MVPLSGTVEARIAYRDLNLRVGFDSFLQTDLGAATALYDDVLEALDAEPGERVIDAYAGIGILACRLGRGRVRSFDLFPQTAHVETVRRVSRR